MSGSSSGHDRPVHVAVVGLGATGAVFTINLLAETERTPAPPGGLELTIFDPAGDAFAGGIAYGTSCDAHILNMRASTMGVVGGPQDFVDWMDTGPSTDELYVPRSIFRDYLRQRLFEATERAARRGIAVRFVAGEVIECSGGDRVELSCNGLRLSFDQVVLCPGETHRAGPAELENTPNYVASSWDHAAVGEIPANHRVGIIGTGLSAVDVLVMLRKRGHRGEVVAVSRSGLLPKVQGPRKHWELQYLTRQNLELLTAYGTRPISLSDVTTLLKLELQDAMAMEPIPWLSVLAKRWGADAQTELQRDIMRATMDRVPWYSALDATSEIIVDYWNALDPHSRQVFQRDWKSLWMTYRHCMPLPNARALQHLFASGLLQVLGGFVGASPAKASGFVLETSEAEVEVDSVVNAKGTGDDPGAVGRHPLVAALVQRGVLRRHTHGGIDVDFSTCRARDAHGALWPNLYVIGPQTSGVHFYTNSIETSARFSEVVAREVVASFYQHLAPAAA